MWSGTFENYGSLKTFGCTTYIYTSDGKLEPRAKKSIFFGYHEGLKGYKVWIKEI